MTKRNLLVNHQMRFARSTWSISMRYRIWRIFGYNQSTQKIRLSLFIQYIYKINILIHFKNTCSLNNYVHLFKDAYFGIHWIIKMIPIESPLNIYQRLTINSFFSISSHCRLIGRFGKPTCTRTCSSGSPLPEMFVLRHQFCY